MFDRKVLVTPLLESAVVVLIVRITSLLDRLVEMDRVFVEQIARCQIRASSKPPRIRRAIRVRGLKVTVVQMDSRGHGIVRMKDKTQPGSEELETFHIRVESFVVDSHLGNGSSRKRAIDDADIHASLLKDISLLQHTRDAAAAMRSFPFVNVEFVAVDCLQRSDNLLLLLLDMCLHS